jgi:hypothetical protein
MILSSHWGTSMHSQILCEHKWSNDKRMRGWLWPRLLVPKNGDYCKDIDALMIYYVPLVPEYAICSTQQVSVLFHGASPSIYIYQYDPSSAPVNIVLFWMCREGLSWLITLPLIWSCVDQFLQLFLEAIVGFDSQTPYHSTRSCLVRKK